jgi:hypothetical protein
MMTPITSSSPIASGSPTDITPMYSSTPVRVVSLYHPSTYSTTLSHTTSMLISTPFIAIPFSLAHSQIKYSASPSIATNYHYHSPPT